MFTRSVLDLKGVVSALGCLLGAKTSEQATIRARVEANVAQTRAANNTSSYKVLTAKENEFVNGYHPDDWTMIQLRKDDVLYDGHPGQSNYYLL